MPKLKSILGLLTMASVMVENPVPKRMIKQALTAFILIITTTVLFVAALLAGIVCLYHALSPSDADTLRASLYATGGVTLTAIISLMAAIKMTKRAIALINDSAKRPVPLTSHLATEATGAIRSFVDGIMNRPQI